ncbi:MAG TPA: urease accessory protein UreE [Stellaceae bacterium]|nr:urease accessory protein UreE [Stellaceae bacterium]
MRRVGAIEPAGHWPSTSRVATVTLGWDDRHRRRARLIDDDGQEFLLDLARPHRLDEGDGLALETGGFIEVKAAPEKLVEIRAREPELLCRLAWHLGNRHLPVRIKGERILIRADHVIADMARGLGAEVREIEAPFTPETGAYGHHHD